VDILSAEERAAGVKDFVRRMRCKGPVFEISALTREGLEPLLKAVYQHIAASKNAQPAPVDPRFDTDADGLLPAEADGG
jgi:GTPase